ncbi:MAG: spinster family MFS transporter [Bacteroidota bacterium]
MRRSYRFKTYYTLSLLVLIYMFDFADRKIMSVLYPHIKEEWLISDTQLSMIGGIVSLVIAVFVIPASIMVDRWSRKKMIILMVFVWSLMTLLCAFAQNYHQLLLFRAMIGIGEAAYAPAAIALISKLFPANRRGIYIGIYDAASPLGIALGMIIGGYIGMIYGWRYALGLVAIPGFILTLLFFFAKDYKTLPIYIDKTKASFNFSTISLIFSKQSLLFVFIAFAGVVGVNTAMIDWAPSFFVRFHGLTEHEAGNVSALIAVSVLIGAPLGGWAGDRLSQFRKNGLLLVACIATLLSSISLFCAVYIQNVYIATIAFCLFGVTSIACLAPGTAVIQNVVQAGIRSVAYGINVLIMNVFGAFLCVYAVGLISDAHNLRTGLLLLPFVMGGASVFFYLASRVYQKDYAAVSKEVL